MFAVVIIIILNHLSTGVHLKDNEAANYILLLPSGRLGPDEASNAQMRFTYQRHCARIKILSI